MNVEIAQRLAAMRREQGYSQEELAEKLGLSRQAVSKWERAESSPDTGNLIALADLYGVTLDELVRLSEIVEPDLQDDMRFEQQDKTASAEAQAQEAAVRANEAAVRAAQAAVAASQARVTAEQASASAGVPAAPQQPPASQSQAMPQQPVPQPQPAHQAAYGAPAAPQPPYASQPQTPHVQDPYAPAQQPRHRGPWMTFPYPILCVVVFLLLGFFFGWWHPGWLVFLTIPLYYWIARIIEDDPAYRANRR